ncbi:hypothetical protein HN51_004451 [Arachis hypogaea]|uniref:Uncharacterized protein LOC107483630 isoform X1 n=1 Tax=Arachis duranensis TaxID=130453 RepID=A0A9C6TVH9_ARADU|nr:uncharacterized protein LOC107483630 isoform X1 [Arachis duranensis]
MFNSHRYKPLIYLNLKVLFRRTQPHMFCTSQSHSLTVSYLINNLGFTPQSALNASKRHRFKTPHKADLIIAFFKTHGFSHSQIAAIVAKLPKILSANPERILPKFQFLASKGASTDDIVLLATRNPRFLHSSLKNNIIPTYGMMKTFFESDQKTLRCIASFPALFMEHRLVKNVKLLADAGVSNSAIHHLCRTRVSVLYSSDLRKLVDEVKELGFDPSSVKFAIALLAKKTIRKSLWDAKVDILKSWGWSKETTSQAFWRNPLCMLSSKDKINEVMKLWVNQLGWDPLALAKIPWLFGYNLERRIIPRAFVLQYLLSRGLRNKNDNLSTPFYVSEELFFNKFVECFTEERSQLRKIYYEKKGCS